MNPDIVLALLALVGALVLVWGRLEDGAMIDAGVVAVALVLVFLAGLVTGLGVMGAFEKEGRW